MNRASGICVLALGLTACGVPLEMQSPDSGSGGGSSAAGGGTQTGTGGGTGGGTTQGTGGGSTQGDPHFCAPCVESSDCGPGAFCLGDPGHCSSDCSAGRACPSQTTCESINLGKAPLGQQCSLTTNACGSLDTRVAGLDCSDGWSGFADGFFGTNCRTCHQTWPGSASDVQQGLETIRLAIDTRSMPPGAANTVSSADRLRILTYLACGAMTPSQTPSNVSPH